MAMIAALVGILCALVLGYYLIVRFIVDVNARKNNSNK